MSNEQNRVTYVFLGGPTELFPANIFEQIINAKNAGKNIKVIGVDHGNIALLSHEIVPDIAVGDFDSLNKTERTLMESKVRDIRYAIPEKDFTDSEMGLHTALFDLHSDRVEVIGATGGRLDHFLVNLFCVLNERLRPFAQKITFIDQQNRIEYFLPGSWKIARKPKYKYLAFVNLTAIADFQIEDAKYRLQDFSNDYPVSFASNEFVTDEVNFSFKSGVLAVIYSRDR